MTYGELASRLNNLRNLQSQASTITFNHADRDIFNEEVLKVTEQILAVDIKISFKPFLPDEYVLAVDVVTTWLTCLINSNAYRLNKEMSYCIEQMIDQFNTHTKKRCVVFTVGNYGLISIKHKVYVDALNILSQRTGVEIAKEPVFVRVPDETKDLMICNQVLFHEVGHFVEQDNDIADAVYKELEDQLSKPGSRIIKNFFPRLIGVNIKSDAKTKETIHYYIGEYIADVFGAQFAHEHILCYLSYLKAKTPNMDDDEHPSYLCRYNMVKDFIAGEKRNYLLNAIFQYMPLLSVVQCPFSDAELKNPNIQFTDLNQLFGSFAACWEIIIKEAERCHIQKESEDNYREILALPIYKELDNNLKRATNDLMNRN